MTADGRARTERCGTGTLRGARAALAAAVVTLVAVGGVELAEGVNGTRGDDDLNGTHGADRIEGKAGDDALRGLTGDDRYVVADGWGTDTLAEKARSKADGTWRRGGPTARSSGSFRTIHHYVANVPAKLGAANAAVTVAAARAEGLLPPNPTVTS